MRGRRRCTPTWSSSRARVLADDLHARPRRRGGVPARLAGPPRRARGAARDRSSRRGFRVVGLLATHADWDHLLGRFAFPDGAARRAARRPRAPARRARRARSASCASSTTSTTSSARAAVAAGASQALPVPGHCELGDAGARAAPRRRPHRRRDGGLDPAGRSVLVVRRLPLAGRDPDDLAGRLARAPTWRRSRGWSRSSSRPRTSSPATARRSTRCAPRRSCARTSPTSRRCPDAPLPLARRTGAQKQIHAANVADRRLSSASSPRHP